MFHLQNYVKTLNFITPKTPAKHRKITSSPTSSSRVRGYVSKSCRLPIAARWVSGGLLVTHEGFSIYGNQKRSKRSNHGDRT